MHIFLKAKEEYLSNKVSQRIVWWSNKRWHSVISINPTLLEQPLWSRSDENLSSVHLFDLTPKQFQEKIQRYWQKPKWKQWLLRLVSPINQQIEAWTYYQECLTFREIQQIQPIAPCLTGIPESRFIIKALSLWLSKQEIRFHQSLANQFRYLKINFEPDLSHHEKKRKKKFLKQLEKELKNSPRGWNREGINHHAQETYQEIEKFLQTYLLLWYNNVYFSPQQKCIEVYTGPSTSSIASNPLPPRTFYSVQNKRLNHEDLVAWIKVMRQEIDKLLEEELPRNNEINKILQESLDELISFSKPRIEIYQRLIRKITLGKEEPASDLKTIEGLQSSLITLLRQASLLFHPDHYQQRLKYLNINELIIIWSDLFVRFKEQSDSIINQFQAGQSNLERWLSVSGKNKTNADYYNYRKERYKVFQEREKRIQEIEKKIQEIEKRIQAFEKERQERERIFQNLEKERQEIEYQEPEEIFNESQKRQQESEKRFKESQKRQQESEEILKQSQKEQQEFEEAFKKEQKDFKEDSKKKTEAESEETPRSYFQP